MHPGVVKEESMRLSAVVSGLVLCGVLFAANGQSVKAQSQNPQNPGTKVVEVSAGDTLTKIGEANGTTYKRLFDANLEIKDPDEIFPGNKVRVPRPDEQLAARPLPQDIQVQVSAPVVSPVPKKQTTVTKPQRRQTTPPPVTSNVYGGVWDRLAQCESGGNWSINTGNGFYGGLQFTLSSWRAVGGSGYPHQASKAEQIARAERLKAVQGWGAWPACSRKLGLR